VQINPLNFSDVPRRSRLFYGGNHIFYGEYRPRYKNVMVEITLSYGGYSTATGYYWIMRAVLFRCVRERLREMNGAQCRLVLGARSQARSRLLPQLICSSRAVAQALALDSFG
jgi:hypothetical protein